MFPFSRSLSRSRGKISWGRAGALLPPCQERRAGRGTRLAPGRPSCPPPPAIWRSWRGGRRSRSLCCGRAGPAEGLPRRLLEVGSKQIRLAASAATRRSPPDQGHWPPPASLSLPGSCRAGPPRLGVAARLFSCCNVTSGPLFCCPARRLGCHFKRAEIIRPPPPPV